MENPDVILEVDLSKDGNKATFSYKVNNRKEDEGQSALEFVEIITVICNGSNEGEDN